MDERDFTRIKVGRFDVGILGLKQLVAEMTETHAGKTDEEIAALMVQELSRRNYIPEGARGEYGEAFVREFRKSVGESTGELPSEGLVVKVLGMGCAQCHSLTQTIMELLTELGLPADLQHVTDVREIARYGAMGVPAIVINGRIVAAGRVPPRNQLRAWLMEAHRSAATG